MPYRVMIIFTLQPGLADTEIERCRQPQSYPNLLAKQPGFISYEVVKLDDDRTMNVQLWRAQEDFHAGVMAATEERNQMGIVEENIVLMTQTIGGVVALDRHVADRV